MKAFFKRHWKLHLWLAAELAFLGLFCLVRGNRAWMNALKNQIIAPFRRFLGSLCYRVDFSVMEVLCILIALGAAAYLIWSIIAVIRAKGRRGGRAYSAVLGAVCAVLTVYGGFFALWGVEYYADSFQERAGVYAQPVATEDLTAVTAYFAQMLQETADTVSRTEAGLFAVPKEQILSESTQVYGEVEELFPFLAFQDRGVKAVHFSRVMSAMNFTGIYCPFTGESNVNVDSPACLLPSTVAHELAHQRGVAAEEECNFLSILACTTSGLADYTYSGWLFGYIHLGNALYRADPEAWQAIRDSLPETVRADLADNNAYWDQFEDKATATITQGVYDGFLKSYGDTDGVQSYGTVVDLLVTWYLPQSHSAGGTP